MPRAVALLFALVIVAASSTTALAQTAAPPGFNVVVRSDLYTGVEYLELAKPKVPVVAHVAHVHPGSPVELRVVNPHDRIPTNSRELETTSSMCRRVRCIAGLNGDFVRAGEPTGGVIVEGQMLRSPHPAFPQLTVTGEGRLTAGLFPWTASVSLADGQELAVTGVNTSAPTDGIVLYTPAYGPRTDASTPARTELLVGASGAVGALNRTTGLELRRLRTGAGPIPADGAVLSAGGAAAQQLLDAWARRQGGMSARAGLLVSSPVDARTSLGAEPVVLRDGRRALPWRDPNLVHPRQPHTLVGWNQAGDVFLVAVDGRQQGSKGVTMAEAADLMLGLGATDAVNLDGGGGTTFAAGGSVWNRPSDDDPAHPAGFSERAAGNAFVLTARAGAPLPAESPAAPTPPTTSLPAAPRSEAAKPLPRPTSRSLPASALLPQTPTVDDGASSEPPSVPGEGLPAEGEARQSPADPGLRAGSAAALPADVERTGTAATDNDRTPVVPAAPPNRRSGGGLSRGAADLPAPLAVASAIDSLADSATGGGPLRMRLFLVLAGGAAGLAAVFARRGMATKEASATAPLAQGSTTRSSR